MSEPVGVLITNLGTPEAPTAAALRRYLAEFLWDRRVVDLPRPLWWIILHGIILRTRPRRSASAYRKVWQEGGPPLMVISRAQAQALGERLALHRINVALGMRYGRPSIGEALRELERTGIRRIVILPLYPQYSSSTTASTFDAVASELRGSRRLPELRFINDYHLEPGYIEALASSIREAWEGREPGQRLIFSFHGTPERFRAEGDPYYDQCHATAQAVAEKLGLSKQRWQVTFQSRFGREAWLQPYTDEVLRALPAEGITSVDILCPGFAADCLETLEEIAMANRNLFLGAGGHAYHYIPALNERPDHLAALASRVTAAAGEWLAPGPQ